jgi:ATP-dependent RNA helicase RhlE
MKFDEFGLSPEILRAVKAEKYETPTPIQEKAIPHVMEGKDLLGCAQTGTGKTAAFALPILNRLASEPLKSGRRNIRCLVLSPTRELASQIADSFTAYGRYTALRNTVVFGGVSQRPQTDALRKGVDVLVATPGRLLDLIQQRFVYLDKIETLVLDEADRMLDMGFINDIRRIIELIPKERQTLMFSATMPYDIRRLADTILHDPIEVAVTPVAATADMIEQFVYYVEKSNKIDLLKELLVGDDVKNALVFSRTKHGADRIERSLQRAGIRVEAIHGDRSQNARERALAAFKKGSTRVLVATDIAARGLDINELSHVINYDLPNEPESYVHRIGRTGRAGLTGVAFSFCAIEERPFLQSVERLIKKHLKVVDNHAYRSELNPGPPTALEPAKSKLLKNPYVISAADFAASSPADANIHSAQRRRFEQAGKPSRYGAGPRKESRRPTSSSSRPR